MNRIQPKELVNLAAKLTLHRANLSVVPDTDEYPWFIRELQDQLMAQEARHELLLPNIKDNNESIAIFSDYGGESPDSKYLTYSFLICAWNQTGNFTKAMETLRNDTGLNSPLKEIAFKDFRYGPIKRALDGYLKNLSNYVNGYLLTVVVEKSVRSIFGTDRKATHDFMTKTLIENGFGKWKPDVAEKILRVTHFAAYLVALLSRTGQKVIWMTDNDAIAPTNERFEDVLKLFGNLLHHYCKHELSTIGGAVPFKEKTPEFLDLLSATDVVAGSVEHYFSRSHGSNDEPLIKQEVSHVLHWLSGQGVALKKHAMIIRAKGDSLVSSTLKFEPKEQDPEAIIVPVIVR